MQCTSSWLSCLPSHRPPRPPTVRATPSGSGRPASCAAPTSSRVATPAVRRTAFGDGDFAQSDFDDLVRGRRELRPDLARGHVRRDAAVRARPGRRGEPRSRAGDGTSGGPVRRDRLPLGTGAQRERDQQSRRDAAARPSGPIRRRARRVGGDAAPHRRPLRRESDRHRLLDHGRAERLRAPQLHRSAGVLPRATAGRSRT